jgi:hypothetical protein
MMRSDFLNRFIQRWGPKDTAISCSPGLEGHDLRSQGYKKDAANEKIDNYRGCELLFIDGVRGVFQKGQNGRVWPDLGCL